jgi:hypothetical protein
MKFLGTFLVGTSDDSHGPKIMTKENLLDRHLHLHSHEIISARWFPPRSKIHATIFARFACGFFLGIGIIGMLVLQWWR